MEVISPFDKSCIINQGVAFGFASDWGFLLNIFAIIVLIYFTDKSRLSSRLMITGAFINLIERVLRGGGVCDFISIMNINFNIADIIVVTGLSIYIYEIRQIFTGK